MTAIPDPARIPEDLDALLEGWRSGRLSFDRGMDQVRDQLQQQSKLKSFVACAPAVAAKLVEVALDTKHAVPNVIPALRLGKRSKTPDPLLHWAVVVAVHEPVFEGRIREADRVALLRAALMDTWPAAGNGGPRNAEAIRHALKAIVAIGGRATPGDSPEGSLRHAVEQAALALGKTAGTEVVVAGFRVVVPAPARATLAAIPVAHSADHDLPGNRPAVQQPKGGDRKTEVHKLAARETLLQRRAKDAEELANQAELDAKRLRARLDEAERGLDRLRDALAAREAEIVALASRCDVLTNAQERLDRSEAQLSQVSSALTALRAEQGDLVAQAREQAAAQAILQFTKLASAPMATLRQLEAALPTSQREVLGACLTQLEISMRPPGG
jgi:hypothetical protein